MLYGIFLCLIELTSYVFTKGPVMKPGKTLSLLLCGFLSAGCEVSSPDQDDAQDMMSNQTSMDLYSVMDLDTAQDSDVDLAFDGSEDMNTSSPPSTTIEWVHTGGGTGNEDEIDAVASDSQGNVYTSGKFEGAITIGDVTLTSRGKADIFVALYDINGTLQWVEQFGGTGEDNIFDAVCDSQDRLILSGYFEGTVDFQDTTLTSHGGLDAVVLSMDRDKRVLWAKKFGGTQSDGGNEVSIDSQDNIVLGVGSNSDLSLSSVHLTSPLSFTAAGDQDAYLFKLDPLGELLWARRLAGARTERAKSIAVLENDDIMFGGDFRGEPVLEGGDMEARKLSSKGQFDAWTSRWSAQGEYLWHKTWGGAGNDIAKGAAHDSSNGAFIVGTFEDTVQFDDMQLTATNSQDIFLAKLSPDGLFLWVRHIKSEEDVMGAELEPYKGGAVFGCSIFAETQVVEQDATFTTTVGAVIQPLLLQFDDEGVLVTQTLLQDVLDGRFDELSVSGDRIFIDMVYRPDDVDNVVLDEQLPRYGKKDFALVSVTLP